MADVRIAVAGASGRMGRTFLETVLDTDGAVLSGAIERPGHDLLGTDAGRLIGRPDTGVPLTDDALDVLVQSDALLDFTAPAATVEFAGLAAQARIVHVIGTTGFSADDEKKIAAAARHATIVKSGNMSLGVNLLQALIRKVAATLDADWDVEVVEMHHRHKVDAPSGTALMFAEAAAEGRGVRLGEVADRGRDGHTGARVRGHIGLAALRGGNVVGEHTTIFAADDERIELRHIAADRRIFARGAVKAALWGQGRPPGIYTMADVLGIDF
ncbi:4-hydroxy-tetrahydrodipicolinate reductase [Futiania mangrovi]|uniref:4-hydroxy-tetrahydrodipicolinate reductase n=1 Tax=Futiania mangrovi TaxID=2959716 RepID=A0A9J6PCU3_9PROT|nr:4-hydroxy-tetrahydrodipicolinate reductase [Futiania mangrovii]MCP1336385.1 4-hydroxy-tetrahydrodipicolinate reductase [Futiania mangrovii]